MDPCGKQRGNARVPKVSWESGSLGRRTLRLMARCNQEICAAAGLVAGDVAPLTDHAFEFCALRQPTRLWRDVCDKTGKPNRNSCDRLRRWLATRAFKPRAGDRSRQA